MRLNVPDLYTKKTRSLHPIEDISEAGGVFEGGNSQVLTHNNFGIVRINLSEKVRKRATDIFSPNSEPFHGLRENLDSGWTCSTVPEELINVVQDVNIALFPGLAEHLIIPEDLLPIVDTHYQNRFNKYHIDALCQVSAVVYTPLSDLVPIDAVHLEGKMRSVVTAFRAGVEEDTHPSSTNYGSANAVGLYPGDVLMFGPDAMHAPLCPEICKLSQRHPGSFGNYNGAHLVDLRAS